MQFTEAGVSLSFEVTYDNPSLFVGMAVFDDSGASPVLVNVFPMLNWYGNSYRAKFTPTAGKSYLINKAVYTDDTYTVIDSDYSQGSESIRADDIAGLVLNATLNDYLESGSVGQAIFKAANANSNGVNLMGTIKPADVLGVISSPELLGIIEEDEIRGGI